MTNEKQMECRYLTPNIPKLRVKVLEVIELVIPDEKNEYVCALNSISQPKDTYKHSDYQTVAKWRERTVAHTIEYLKLNCPTCYFTSEHLRLFTTYLFGILLPIIILYINFYLDILTNTLPMHSPSTLIQILPTMDNMLISLFITYFTLIVLIIHVSTKKWSYRKMICLFFFAYF